jgi:hypothetical protein
MTTPAYAAYFGCTVQKTQQMFTPPNGDRDSRGTIVKKGDELRIEDRFADWLFVSTETDQGWIPASTCQRQEVRDYLEFRRRNPNNCCNEGRCP